MTTLRQRLLRWWHEPRIRLPAPGLSAGALRPGDRLQVGSRLWRIAACRHRAAAASFDLIAADGPADRARLLATTDRWSLQGIAGADSVLGAIELDPAAVIHFSVGG